LKRSAPTLHTQKPDTTKLIRCTEDALQGVCWHDDCQVVSQQATKVWADVDSVKIVVEECMTWGES
jgi:Holliday junction resolvase RusA-like endonuclease